MVRCRASTLSSAVNSLSSTGISFSRMDEKEKQQALEEEQARLQALKVTSPLFILPKLSETGRRNSYQIRESRWPPFFPSTLD